MARFLSGKLSPDCYFMWPQSRGGSPTLLTSAGYGASAWLFVLGRQVHRDAGFQGQQGGGLGAVPGAPLPAGEIRSVWRASGTPTPGLA